MKRTISILGSTGSIGTQSLDVCRMQGYQIMALTAYQNAELLEKQAREFSPKYVALSDKAAAAKLKAALADTGIRVGAGDDGVLEAASMQADTVINSLTGVAGLLPTCEVIRSGNNLALANKETLVAGGKLVMDQVRAKGITLTPIDSEHSAIFQCLQGNQSKQVAKLIITASGGPFYGYSAEKLKTVTKQQALCHPNWSMGQKITIDSATLMNKGLEFIEAMWLFDVPPEQIEIVVHRQSIIHSMVEYVDGSVMAQMGAPDMRVPIQYALTSPERFESPAKRLNLLECGELTFASPDIETFSCLADCIQAAKMGGLYPCLLNGANEQAVHSFLAGKIGFTDIFLAVRRTLEHFSKIQDYQEYQTVQEVLMADAKARQFVKDLFRIER